MDCFQMEETWRSINRRPDAQTIDVHREPGPSASKHESLWGTLLLLFDTIPAAARHVVIVVQSKQWLKGTSRTSKVRVKNWPS